MLERDKRIIEDLRRFRVLTREQITALHFAHLKDATTQTNRVLNRLRRDGMVTANRDYRMYRYFPAPGIKRDSTKIPHYLEIANAYLALCRHEVPRIFDVEPRVLMEPDAFVIWRRQAIYLEVQRNIYSKKQMERKFDLYDRYYESREWEKLSWQPSEKKVFPIVLMISDHAYVIEKPYRVIMSRSVEEYLTAITRTV